MVRILIQAFSKSWYDGYISFVDIMQKEGSDMCPLNLACSNGQFEMAKYLITEKLFTGV